MALKYKDKVLTVRWESAIKNMVFLKGKDIPTFISTLDKNFRKYILQSTADYGIIDYHDDIDVYLVRRTGDAYKGVIVTRFKESTVRQLTHNCYSLDSAIVRNLLNYHSFLGSMADLEVLLVTRHGGMRKGIGHQSIRIEELYRLDREDVLEAMSGVNSLVPEWRAEYLENSAYIKLMRLEMHQITDALAEEAFGYNAASMVAEPLYNKLERVGDQRHVRLPPSALIPDKTGFAAKTLFFYNDDGLYMGYKQQNANVEIYIAPSDMSTANSAEIFSGYTSETLDGCSYANTIEDEDLEHWGFRCYLCSLVSGVPNEIWNDVTDSNLYTYTAKGPNGKPVLTWDTASLTANKLYPCVKIGKYTHLYVNPKKTLTWEGYMSVTVQSNVNFQGVQTVKNQRLSPGVIDVFVNGITMIEGLDYIVKWPTIVITNRQLVPIDYSDAEVIVRTRGWCNPVTMKHHATRDWGWIKDGYLSFNGKYDPRRDRNYRLIIDGTLYDPSLVVWTEDQSPTGNTIARRPYVDGKAYMVGEVYTVVEPWCNQKSVPYRAKAMEIDKRVGDYLTPRLPEIEETLPEVNGLRWSLYSPFLAAILHQLTANEWLTEGELDASWGNEEVAAWVAPYLTLLDFDPVNLDHDPNYVWIYPHTYVDAMKITSSQYRLVDYINRNYLKSKVRLNNSIIVEN